MGSRVGGGVAGGVAGRHPLHPGEFAPGEMGGVKAAVHFPEHGRPIMYLFTGVSDFS